MQENKVAVIGQLLRQFNPSHRHDDPIYTPDGERRRARVERWLMRSGVTAWPRTETGQLRLDSDPFRLMSRVQLGNGFLVWGASFGAGEAS